MIYDIRYDTSNDRVVFENLQPCNYKHLYVTTEKYNLYLPLYTKCCRCHDLYDTKEEKIQ